MLRFVFVVVFFVGTINAVPRLDGRIVGGETVTIGEYPYTVSLQNNGRHQCGGSILSEKFILTAAHCVAGTIAQNWKIRAGSSYYAKGGQVIPVYKIHQHELYNPYTSDYDIAILELFQSIVYGLAQPIGLPKSPEESAEGVLAAVTGWGYTTARKDKAEQLQLLHVPVISRTQCQQLYSGFNITERMICAGILKGGKDACQGDSGGPLAHDGSLIGIVSWGLGCAQPNQPGVYTNVIALIDYIKSVTKLA